MHDKCMCSIMLSCDTICMCEICTCQEGMAVLNSSGWWQLAFCKHKHLACGTTLWWGIMSLCKEKFANIH